MSGGQRGHQLIGPESLSVIGEYILDKDQLETVRVVGAYYANSYARFHTLGEKLGDEIGRLAGHFRWTLLPIVSVISFLGGSVLVSSSEERQHEVMAETTPTKPSGTTTPSSTSGAQSQPAGSGSGG